MLILSATHLSDQVGKLPMFSSGDGVIVLGDSTTHGGKVVSVQSNYLLKGKPVAFHGCHTACGAALISAASGKHGLR